MGEICLFKPLNACWMALALLLMQSWVQAESEIPERIEWKKVPIQLALVVGQEQRIEFPAAVKVGVPAAIQPRLRTQSVNGTLYLLAHAPFASSRLMVKELDSGRIYLFDVSASEEGRAERLLDAAERIMFASDFEIGEIRRRIHVESFHSG